MQSNEIRQITAFPVQIRLPHTAKRVDNTCIYDSQQKGAESPCLWRNKRLFLIKKHWKSVIFHEIFLVIS